MFDYQAGEKYRLTLIMVGFAGVIAGVFFTCLLMGDTQAAAPRVRQAPKWASNPDVTGRAGSDQPGGGHPTDGTAPQQPAEPYAATDGPMAQQMIETWLGLGWDLSAGSAHESQNKAMQYMTPDCAAKYRENIWTPDLAKQIEEAGLQSRFIKTGIRLGETRQDGAVVVVVDGQHDLAVNGQIVKQRPVQVEYLVKSTKDGMRITGISEGTGSGQAAGQAPPPPQPQGF